MPAFCRSHRGGTWGQEWRASSSMPALELQALTLLTGNVSTALETIHLPLSTKVFTAHKPRLLPWASCPASSLPSSLHVGDQTVGQGVAAPLGGITSAPSTGSVAAPRLQGHACWCGQQPGPKGPR